MQGENTVPPEIKRWLVQTFSTRKTGKEPQHQQYLCHEKFNIAMFLESKKRRSGEKRTLRGVVHAVQAGMFVERMFRKSSAASSSTIPLEIKQHLEVLVQ